MLTFAAITILLIIIPYAGFKIRQLENKAIAAENRANLLSEAIIDPIKSKEFKEKEKILLMKDSNITLCGIQKSCPICGSKEKQSVKRCFKCECFFNGEKRILLGDHLHSYCSTCEGFSLIGSLTPSGGIC